MRADMATGDDDFVGCRSAVAADHVTVTTLKDHAKRWVVGRLWHAVLHGLGQINQTGVAQGSEVDTQTINGAHV